ncbi:MAG: hypothetical protein Q7R73_03525 [bacterium]|nr:hypothetical protein [bacterium]
MRIKKHPLLVVFEEVECCVLRHAFSKGAYADLLDAVIEEVAKTEIIPPHDLSILAEIFINTLRLGFIPGIVHRVFYSKVAYAEKEAIGTGNVLISCGHTKEEHIKALDRIIWLMACPQGQN